MERVIKFRAWDNDRKLMYYNVGIDSNNTIPRCVKGGDIDSLKLVDDYVLEQFTGLHDKNGKEIYEGDVCWTYEIGIGNLNRVVVFDDGAFCFKHDNMLTSQLRGWKSDYMEITSNIHERG